MQNHARDNNNNNKINNKNKNNNNNNNNNNILFLFNPIVCFSFFLLYETAPSAPKELFRTKRKKRKTRRLIKPAIKTQNQTKNNKQRA